MVCLFSLIYMHFMFWNLGFRVFEKFWGFSKLMSYCWNFGMGVCLNEFKISCIASHKNYNSYHAFRCVQIDYVLVGLDWAEPMMHFLLHVTCSWIPHAYVLYFQYTCYILNVLGLFWLSLSLPLFSVYINRVYVT